jgi:BirA family transcriptional regulator, biotin operon repressor / biotin---[acetyl-CoA-carboxylase] ligase
LGMMTSIAVSDTLDEAGISARVRWPNDVLVQNKKIAGILPEARIAGSNIEVAIIGIGVNVNSFAETFPEELRDQVTSMLICTGSEWSIEETARLLLHKLDLLYGRAKFEGCGFVPDLWARVWAHRGCRVSRDGLTGIAEGIDHDGALLLRTDNGRLEKINSGVVMPLP